jgi:tetratricopeptide (TPR) repeat protein
LAPTLLKLYGKRCGQTFATMGGLQTLRGSLGFMRKGQRGKKIGPSSGRAALSPKDRLRQQAYGLRNVRNFPQAKPLLEELYKLEPDNMPLALDLGEAYMETEDFASATSLYAKLIEKDPKNINAVTNLGGSLIRQGKLNDARSILEYALQLDPKSIHARINLGSVLQASGELKANLDNALEAVQIDPSSSLAFNNLGSAFSDMAMFKEAKHAYETAVMLDSQQVDALINLAAVEARLGDSKASAEMYERVLKLLPKEAEQRAEAVKFYAAFEYLKQGVLEKGWDYYEGGFSPLVPANGARSPRRTFSVPRWDGKPLNGKTLLVWREQGLGDELLFYTCLHELKEMGGNIIVECDKRLVEVMARSFPEFTIRAEIFLPQQEGRSPHSDFDFHLPAGSLMRHFRPTLESFNRSGAYIKPDPARVAKFQKRLAPYKEDYRLIGICWRSGKLDPVRNLSYTTLGEWEEVLQTPGFKFVNLQYGECEAELKAAEEKYGIEILRWPDLNLRNDLDDIFALMTCLDAVASVQTAVLTMAGCADVPSAGVKAGGWTALGRRLRSPWFDHVIFQRRIRFVKNALRTAYLDRLLQKEVNFLEGRPEPRSDSDVLEWGESSLNSAITLSTVGVTAKFELAEQLLNTGNLSSQGAQSVVEILDRRGNRTVGYLEKCCSIAYKLLLNGFVKEAHTVGSLLVDAQESLSPSSKKDFAVLLVTQGSADEAQQLIQLAYKEDPDLRNGYSELASLVSHQSFLDRAIYLYEQDFDLNRMGSATHFHNLLRLYAFQHCEEKVSNVIEEMILNKRLFALKDPYATVARAAWQATGFRTFDPAIWNLDDNLGLSSFDKPFKDAWVERVRGDFDKSFRLIEKSFYVGGGIFFFPMYEVLLRGKANLEKWLTLPVYSTRSEITSSPVHLSLLGRYEEGLRATKQIYAQDRLSNKNLFWWMEKCQALIEGGEPGEEIKMDLCRDELASFRYSKLTWTVALSCLPTEPHQNPQR